MRTQQIEEKAAVGRSKQLGASLPRTSRQVTLLQGRPRGSSHSLPPAPSQHDTLVEGTRRSPGASSLQRQEPHRQPTAKQALPTPPPQLHKLRAGYFTLSHSTDSGLNRPPALLTHTFPTSRHCLLTSRDTATALLVHGQGERQPRGTALVCRKDVPAPHTSLGTRPS